VQNLTGGRGYTRCRQEDASKRMQGKRIQANRHAERQVPWVQSCQEDAGKRMQAKGCRQDDTQARGCRQEDAGKRMQARGCKQDDTQARGCKQEDAGKRTRRQEDACKGMLARRSMQGLQGDAFMVMMQGAACRRKQARG
jgi:hypothetical protein